MVSEKQFFNKTDGESIIESDSQKIVSLLLS